MAKRRADQLLVEQGLAETRTRAQALILAGLVSADGRRIDKPGTALAPETPLALADALVGYLEGFAANLVSAALRLGVIGQTDGQRILAALEPVVAGVAEAAMGREPADFGAATFAADLASMAHESQHVRLFRS